MSDIGQWLRNSKVAGKDSLRFITSLRYDTSAIKALNNMTFFYDYNWHNTGNTLPVAFFYITNYSEVMTSEISQKTMLFYNSAENTGDATKGGLLGVVADNIVNKPKKYKLEVVVPASFSQLDKIYQFDNYTRLNVASVQSKSYENESVLTGSTLLVSTATSTLVSTLIRSLITALTAEELVSQDILTSLLTMSTSNKDSLSEMWGNRTILKLKLPNGWKFKYVAIEAMNLIKKGEDGDFFTGTIEVTELPIMTVDRNRRITGSSRSSALKNTFKTTFESLMNRIEKVI